MGITSPIKKNHNRGMPSCLPLGKSDTLKTRYLQEGEEESDEERKNQWQGLVLNYWQENGKDCRIKIPSPENYWF